MSRLWQFDPIASLQSLPSVFFVCFTMCDFGRAYKKCTRFLTNFEPLRGLERGCPGLSPTYHHLLCRSLQIFKRGRPRWVCATAWAGEYPHPLCRLWVQLLLDHAPDGALDRGHGRGLTAPAESPRALQTAELAAAASELAGAPRSAQAQRSGLWKSAVAADGEPAGGSQARVDIGGSSGSGYCSLAKEFLRAGGVAPFRRGR